LVGLNASANSSGFIRGTNPEAFAASSQFLHQRLRHSLVSDTGVQTPI
jgi:hypothetical protein